MYIAKSLISIAALAVIAVPALAAADEPSLSGSYTLDEQRSDEMVEAFEPAIEEMSWWKRGVARRVARREDNPAQRLRIEKTGDEVTIDPSDGPPRTFPLDGEVVEYEDADDNPVRVSARVEEGTLVMDYDIVVGEYTAYFRLRGDRLELVRDMDLDRLPRRIEYRLVYRRD